MHCQDAQQDTENYTAYTGVYTGVIYISMVNYFLRSYIPVM